MNFYFFIRLTFFNFMSVHRYPLSTDLLFSLSLQLFYSFFKTLVGKEVAVELKNDVVLTGTLHSVDQYLNIKLNNVQVVDKQKYPQLLALKNCFIRGSVVRYIQIPSGDVDTELLQDAARKENAPQKAS
jgi:U6 snRNA-associated Sm-like protein LSm2